MKDCPKIKNYLKDKYKYKDNIIYTILASVIAALGLLKNNSTLVAGSMLLSPILAPITYLLYSFNISKIFKQLIILVSISISIGYGSSLILKNEKFNLLKTSPLFSITPEIESRAESSLFLYNFIIAIIVGIVFILTFRHGIEDKKGFLGESVILVAIGLCISILPPLVSVGILLQKKKYLMAQNALVLFLINILGFLIGSLMTSSIVC